MLKFFIRKPIAVLMTTLAIIILGITSSFFIPISLMPDIDIPKITIQVNANNMSARELEDVVVKTLRIDLMQVKNLEDLESKTSDGFSTIRLDFKHGTKTNYSFIEVNEKIDRAMRNLPRDIARPKVIKSSATDVPAFYLNISLKNEKAVESNGEVTKAFMELSELVTQVLRKRIEQASEVAMVDLSGLVTTEILIIPDEGKLVSLGLGVEDIEAAINGENLEIGSITVKEGQYQYNIRLENSLTNDKDLEQLYIRKDDRLFQLKDLAQIQIRPKRRTGLIVLNNKEAISMAIIKQSDARINNLKRALDTSIDEMKNEYPSIDFSINRDQTKFLQYTISNLKQSLLFGISLAFLVIFFFLKDIRSSFLICIIVPVSILVSLLFFYLFNISLNIVSISGLILGSGLMIDNSIVVIDNITQHKEMGLSLTDACIQGANQVFRPLLSSVLTTCAVFIPLIFLNGITGELFYDQAMAISIGLGVSLIASTTLLPVLYRMLYIKSKRTQKTFPFFKNIKIFNYEPIYRIGFRFTLRRPKLMFFFFMSFIIVTLSLFHLLPKDQMPRLTNVETLIDVNWNEPINIEENKRRIIGLASLNKDISPEYYSLIGKQEFILDKNSNVSAAQATLYLKTKTSEELQTIQISIVNNLRENYPNAHFEFLKVDNVFNLILGNNDFPLTVKLKSLEQKSNEQNKRLNAVLSDLQLGLPDIPFQPIEWKDQLVINVDKEKLALYNISSKVLEKTLKSAFYQNKISSIVDGENLVPIKLVGNEQSINDVLEKTTLRANDGTYFPLNEFTSKTLTRNVRTITAGKGGEYYPIDFSIQKNQEKEIIVGVKKVLDMYPEQTFEISGNIYKNHKLIRELSYILIVTLLLLYFILASQFESLTLPLIILIEIPISIGGALLFLYLFKMSINLMSLIGIVVMCGIIINDSILKIDTVLQLQKKGNSLIRSLFLAGHRRLKPILMTSITTNLALIPTLFMDGLGSELQAPLAVAIIGGMSVGTLVSLYFIPLSYYLVRK